MEYATEIQQLIGRTPVLELTHSTIPNGCRIFAKLEFFNPGGSVKDRLGVALIADAEKRGELKAGGTIVEPTAGNTGIGLAIAAIGKGYRLKLVVPQKFSMEKQTLMRALGAEVINTPTADGIKGAIKKATEIAEQEGAFMPAQFANAANPDTYVQTLGPELWEQMDGKIDIFVAGAGSGGTFMGTSRFLKAQNPKIKTVIVEPEGSILNGGESGPHKTEGIGMELLPPFMDTEYFGTIHTITDKAAFAAVAELAQSEGLLVGSSSGAAFVAALKEAENAPFGSSIATVFADSSERYLSQDIYGALFKEEQQ
ncbi:MULTISPECIES: PLP-dependent cysteine synthase family protein [unclassified Planococcus (in: firmicutes)]|uniref:PLP-dependent cysteine synthase family protein n=1 Tax=unclassified Planococcus (in: firmicutes) TaxID=2662419 RepID=UPI000C33CA39|nr:MULTISPECIES: cysteine synthase family protein [unclassified Planococcus (in: firmicutes)]AUD14674.1 cysteine synthase [Planococcus sp. MB-3u-03]PKG44977.1 cysteine synthase [Planococcus sp. Urea-trap-24]PKG87320.1 cysteine synthase [Planococcus sp. Urea-3u-39]PKH42445.1 cysteine synthase [Planococcus sp. MB-3u-09]